MRKVNKFQCIIIAFLLGLIVVFVGGGGIASADNNSGYSNAIDDLQKDKNFNAWDYPAVPTDYKLEVIQIAESKAGELFIYVYQPSGAVADLRATCVNMALSEDVNGTDFYNLKYVNSSGVFYKYIVEGVKVSSASERFYNITSILREWNEDYDGFHSDNTQIMKEKAFPVGQLWQVTSDIYGKIIYKMERTDIVIIERDDMIIGMRRVKNGSTLGSIKYTDLHYIAFNCDHRIDELLEADVSFTTQYYYKDITGEKVNDPEPQKAMLKGGVMHKNKPFGAFGQSYEWEEIQPVSEFIINGNLSETDKSKLSKFSWVLNFCGTEYGGSNTLTSVGLLLSPATAILGTISLLSDNSYGTVVSDVSILRLKFQTARKVYNLGVVSNKQSGSIFPANKDGGLEWWEILLIVIAVVVVLSLALKILSLFVPFFGVLLQGLLFIITSPFQLIIWIVKKIRGE